MNSSKKEILISKIKKLLKLDTNIKDHNKLEKEINNKINKEYQEIDELLMKYTR